MKKFVNGSITLDNGTKLTVEKKTILATPGEKDSKWTYSYPTMVRLAHNGENNGTLVAAHATLYGPCNDNGYKVYKSYDDGDSWTFVSKAVDNYTKYAHESILQPCLFELPCDMGDFKEGTLFMGGCSRGNFPDKSPMTAMALYYSTDLGNSWTAYHTLAVGRGAVECEGVWEPFFIYEEESGRVYCFYSDETNASGTKNGPKAQELVYKYTTDMKNWSDVQVAMSCTDKENMRPGMVAISKTPIGYLMTYELVGLDGSPTYCKIVDRLDNWGDVSDVGFPIVTDDNKTMGTAPWSAWTQAGGENGLLFSVANHMIACESIDKTGTDMFVSFDYGKTNVAIENPSTFVQNRKNKLSYSSYIGFSEDGYTMYYINSINFGPDNTQIEFVRIKITD